MKPVLTFAAFSSPDIHSDGMTKYLISTFSHFSLPPALYLLFIVLFVIVSV